MKTRHKRPSVVEQRRKTKYLASLASDPSIALGRQVLSAFKALDVEARISDGSYMIPEPIASELKRKRARFWLFKGGRGSGKSLSIACELLRLSYTDGFKGGVILCLREVQKSIKDSTFAMLEGLINDTRAYARDFEVLKTGEIRNKATGCRFIFMGMSSNGGSTQHNARDKIRSTYNVKAIFCDEAQALADESLEVLFPTVDRQAKIRQIDTLYSLADERIEGVTIEENTRFYFAMNPRLGANDPITKKLEGYLKVYGSEVVRICHVNITDLPVWAQSPTLLDQMKADEARGLINFEHVWKGAPLASLGAAIFAGLPVTSYDWSDDLRYEIGARESIYCFVDPATTFNNDATSVTFMVTTGVSYSKYGFITDGKIKVWGMSWAKPFKHCLADIKQLIIDSSIRFGDVDEDGNPTNPMPVILGLEDNAIKDIQDYFEDLIPRQNLYSYHSIGSRGHGKFEKIETVGVSLTGADIEIVEAVGQPDDRLVLCNQHWIDGLRDYMPKLGRDDEADSLVMCAIHAELWREPNVYNWRENGSYMRETIDSW